MFNHLNTLTKISGDSGFKICISVLLLLHCNVFNFHLLTIRTKNPNYCELVRRILARQASETFAQYFVNKFVEMIQLWRIRYERLLNHFMLANM